MRRMALYKVNTGSREQEVVKLRWDWEIPIPEFNTCPVPAAHETNADSTEACGSISVTKLCRSDALTKK